MNQTPVSKKPIIQLENFLNEMVELYLNNSHVIKGRLLDTDQMNNLILSEASINGESLGTSIFVKSQNIETINKLED